MRREHPNRRQPNQPPLQQVPCPVVVTKLVIVFKTHMVSLFWRSIDATGIQTPLPAASRYELGLSPVLLAAPAPSAPEATTVVESQRDSKPESPRPAPEPTRLDSSPVRVPEGLPTRSTGRPSLIFRLSKGYEHVKAGGLSTSLPRSRAASLSSPSVPTPLTSACLDLTGGFSGVLKLVNSARGESRSHKLALNIEGFA